MPRYSRRWRERLRLPCEPFAASDGLAVETLRNRETGKREPDATARGNLRAIANNPGGVATACAPDPGPDT